MKIAVPTGDKKGLTVAEHFGRCPTYTFLNEKGEVLKIIANTSEDRGGKGLPPELMKAEGADIILCNDMGPKAVILSNKLGIKVYIGQAKTVKEMFAMWRSHMLEEADAEKFRKLY